MSNELSPEQIAQILQGITVPPQPQILVDLQMEQIMPEPDIERIAELISKDVGLAGTMLKFVNSPFYGLANKITSIEQAVSLLGGTTVINILNGLAIKGEMSDENIVALTRFWDTATDIAMVCATVAKQVGYPNPDEAYTLGLFHNVGIPLMMKKFDDYLEFMEEAYSGEYERIIDAENRQYNTNHCVVGYYTGKSWNLPTHICHVIAEHHNTQRIFSAKDGRNQQQKTLLAILKIAEHICGNYRIFGNQEKDVEWDLNAKDILEHLGLSTYDIDELKEFFREMGANVY
ncbi:MAG: HDOD domain-containing protein [Oleiphilaceae bacterium]|nr:HDOD domain-containing protein [Oleiphilaceae bacterium]